VAIEKNADKPKVVVAESRLAQSYLPPPPEADVAFAVARATKADPIDYAKQMEFGRKLATAVNKAWEKLEADQKEAARVSGLKDARIVELTKEVERVKKDASAQTWTWIGGALAVAGALCTAFLGPRVGLPLIGCGMLCGAVPFIIESEYFSIIVATTLAGCACLLLWYIFDKVSDAVQDKKDEAEISKDE
jgi:predicted XRE-type DNA-binding protein